MLLIATMSAQVILSDMIPFMTLLSFAMIGCTMFFTIHNSELESGIAHGMFRMLVRVYRMTLGIGQGDENTTEQDTPMTVLVVATFFTSFVVVVL